MSRNIIANILFVLSIGLSACVDAGQEFDDFLARADRTPPELPDAGVSGQLTDVTGNYLINIALRPLGDVYLELRLTFTEFTLSAEGDSAAVAGEFRFTDETLEAPPLATFQTTMDAAGQMSIDVGFVRIEADRSPIEDTAVETELIFDMIVLDVGNVCGVVSDEGSRVLMPIQLDLRGTTFGGERYGDNGEMPVDVPTECPGGGQADPEPDAGEPDAADAGGDVPDADLLQPPDVDLGTGARADVTGTFWLEVKVAGTSIELQLLLDLVFHQGEAEASLDGSLRSIMADLGAPAIATFSRPVDENGEFSVVLLDFRSDSPLGEVVADIALAGIIRDADTICGAGAGTVYQPLEIDLDGTTFGAVRVEAGTIEAPENAIDVCPE